jgi:hypothetical protein
MKPWDRSEKVRTFTRALLVLAIASTIACAQKDWIDRTLVTENVTGSWYGAMGGRDGLWLTFKQEGSKVTGEFHTTGYLASWISTEGPIEGTVAGDVLTFADRRGTFRAETRIDGDEMTGQILTNRPVRIILRRVDASTIPASPPR